MLRHRNRLAARARRRSFSGERNGRRKYACVRRLRDDLISVTQIAKSRKNTYRTTCVTRHQISSNTGRRHWSLTEEDQLGNRVSKITLIKVIKK